jgi:hypothetical protein
MSGNESRRAAPNCNQVVRIDGVTRRSTLYSRCSKASLRATATWKSPFARRTPAQPALLILVIGVRSAASTHS